MKRTLISLIMALVPWAAVHAKGPIGLGPLQIGMTKEAIGALQATDGIYLVSPMTPFDYKNISPKLGEEKFDGLIATPLSVTPLKAVLTFESGQLKAMSVSLDPSTNILERIAAQIVEKYGAGKVEDTRKEEQCIYKNGANFKVMSGAVFTDWSEEFSAKERVETRLTDVSMESCPSNLRTGGIGPVKIRALSFRKVQSSGESKPRNLF